MDSAKNAVRVGVYFSRAQIEGSASFGRRKLFLLQHVIQEQELLLRGQVLLIQKSPTNQRSNCFERSAD